MSFVEDRTGFGVARGARVFPGGLTPRLDTVPPAQSELPGPSIEETAGAAFRLYNDVTNGIQFVQRQSFAPTPGYNPLDTIKGTVYEHDYLNNFVGVQSEGETRAIMGRIDSELKDRETLSRAGWQGIAAAVAAGTLSPTMLIPIAGWISRGVALGRAGRIALTAGEAALATGAGVVTQEALLQQTQETRTLEESFWNVAGATAVGGVLGAGLGALAGRAAIKGIADKALSTVPGTDEDAARMLNEAVGENVTGPQSAGAAATDATRGSGKLKGALGFESTAIRHQDPLFRSLTSPFRSVRNTVRDLAEIPGTLEENALGIPTTEGGSVEYLARSFDYPLASATRDMSDAYTEYFFGRAGVPLGRARAGLAQLAGRSGKMSFTEFKHAVFDAMYSGDVSPIPEVQRAAQAFRTKVEEPLKKQAIELRLFTEDVKPGDDVSHVFRVWDTDSIAANRGTLVGILAKDFGERIQGLEQRIAEMTAKGEPVDDALKEAARMTPDEIKSLAEQSVDTILGFSPERAMMPRDIVQGPRGALKERVLRVPTAKVGEFVVKDVAAVERMMVRTVATDLAFLKKFGSLDMGEQIAKINDEAARLVEANPEQSAAITKAQANAIRDIEAMRDRLRGTYGIPHNANGLLQRALRVVRNYNVITKLGNVVPSSISDVGKIVANYGLNNAMRVVFHPFMRGFKSLRLAGKEAELANSALDMILHSRQMAINDITDVYARGTVIERGSQYLTDKFGLVSLMDPWNTTVRKFAGIMAQTKMLQSVERIVDGTASVREIEYAAANGIDRNMAERIGKQFAAKGQKDGPVWWANTEAWKDDAAVNAVRAALHREINRTIVTPGQDISLWMSRPLGRMLGQFHSFAVASVQRTILTGLQQRDMAALNGAMLMLGLGAASYAIKTKIAGRDLPDPRDKPGVWAQEALNNSGLTGWLFDANAILEKATQGNVGIRRLTGAELSKYQALDLFSTIGPSAGVIKDLITLLGDVTGSPFTQSDSATIRRMIPFQNVFYLRWLFDKAKNGADQAFGIPKNAPRQ